MLLLLAPLPKRQADHFRVFPQRCTEQNVSLFNHLFFSRREGQVSFPLSTCPCSGQSCVNMTRFNGDADGFITLCPLSSAIDTYFIMVHWSGKLVNAQFDIHLISCHQMNVVKLKLYHFSLRVYRSRSINQHRIEIFNTTGVGVVIHLQHLQSIYWPPQDYRLCTGQRIKCNKYNFI